MVLAGLVEVMGVGLGNLASKRLNVLKVEGFGFLFRAEKTVAVGGSFGKAVLPRVDEEAGKYARGQVSIISLGQGKRMMGVWSDGGNGEELQGWVLGYWWRRWGL